MLENLNSPYIHAATADNFQALVLDNSHKGPVLVNFWSKGAGPCLRLYPLLDKIIHHYDGRVLLINIDADKEVGITKQYGIASVPTLKLFRHEDVVETRHGYQSEDELRKLLEPYVARDSDLVLADALQLYVGGKTVEAYEKIATAIVDDPLNHRLPLTMCKLLRHEGRFAEAIKLIDSMPSATRNNKEVTQYYDLLNLLVEADLKVDIDSLLQHLDSHPDDLPARRQLVVQYVMQQDYAAALQQLVAIMELDAEYDGRYPQQAMLRIFNILGSEHPLIGEYRKNLSRYTH